MFMDWNTCHNISKDPHAIQKYEMFNLSNVFPDTIIIDKSIISNQHRKFDVQNLSIISNEAQDIYFEKLVELHKHGHVKKLLQLIK